MSVEAWIAAWTHAWRGHDPDALASAYADGARFRPHPFRDVADPRAYAEWAFADEDELVDLRWGEPVVAGERAFVEYWAVVRTGGREETIAGVSLLRLDAGGRVAEQRDYWAAEPGRREPPDGWGR